ncbi:hypothetical protein I2I11_13375 [Pontibacter sp. 172403-2]|uniref:hypothetical protein n=1 Tax=Pontibacter rufus TaxID=2791028 RepID=UPI0018AFD265|nr:hypothetical protein [Pontibacter sp. 172403-2]MBF9254290.1 hypothetical protein [Pontibacter sp. 172403-2]
MDKRILGIACACLLSCQALHAQEATQPLLPQELTHEVYAGYGLLSLPVVVNGLGDYIGNAFVGGGDEKHVLGPIMIGYTYFISKKVGIGIEAGYTSYASRYSNTGELDFRNSFLVVMPHGEFYWARLRSVDFFSGIKVGGCYIKTDDGNADTGNAFTTAFHLTTIGVRVGRKLGFYMDSGVGFDGFTNAGLSLRF